MFVWINTIKNYLGYKELWNNDDGIATVELILILVVLIAVVLIFKDQITGLVNDIFDTITDQAGKV
ncbi:Putative Flagellin, Flp1-like, domain [Lachnospiraceae bacterium XBB1006]|nr:Putative Flagellin, Flp1-like, domain [Lachnospiraceae bacterium XBB1006]